MSQAIIYTITDEAPALATRSLLPVIQAFANAAGVPVETRDISLAGRILATFPELLRPDQRIPDALAELGELAKTPDANIIKLPNVSASVPQLRAAITELRSQGFNLPDYPEEGGDAEDQALRGRYAKVLGSAVNPVLREGNSDRRVAKAVKKFAQLHPHRMGAWSPDSKTHVAHMTEGDFYGSERSVVMAQSGTVDIVFHGTDGTASTLKKGLALSAGEILDAAVMSRRALCTFYRAQIADAKAQGVLLSLHLKATMMKVSDPVFFGYCVEEFFRPVFEAHGELFAEIGVDSSLGLADLLARVEKLPAERKQPVLADIQAAYAVNPPLAMVDSDKGITNLHVPSDIIIDASMPPMIRDSGRMWGADGKLHDTKALIPDRCYATIYQATIDDCKAHGAFNPGTMGSVANVGLMARKAEEYGSHDKTFRITKAGTVQVVDGNGTVLLEHAVEPGDIWRACQTKASPVKDWVKLAVTRARATGVPAVFWLDPARAHDALLIGIVRGLLSEHDTQGLEIAIMTPVEAIRHAMARARAGQDTISVTGNVLRDFLTDLFPIIELGTSAKMLSIVPLLAGGGLYETGAGGSAPKHVQQFVAEGHLRWDSLGEFLALGVSLEDLATKTDNPRAALLAEALDTAIGQVLEQQKSPGRKAGELDNRGSHFYLCLYWARALAAQHTDPDLEARFRPFAETLGSAESTIVSELLAASGHPVDIGGYYRPDDKKADAAMRPSKTWNAILATLK